MPVTYISTSQPFDLVDLFLYLQALQVIELGFVTLKLGEKAILGIVALNANRISGSRVDLQQPIQSYTLVVAKATVDAGGRKGA